jgi:uncharacterized protein YdiU (UPF0061 family)
MRAKLGLFGEEEGDADLAQALLRLMRDEGADYTRTLRDLSRSPLPDAPFFRGEGFRRWNERWQARIERQRQSPEESRQLMRAHNPAVIPRNHRVEEALAAAAQGDIGVMKRLLTALENPFRESPEHADLSLPPAPSAAPYKTFCGT